MKKLVTAFLIILLMFSSCKNQNFIEYIGKGFAKPAVSDVKFSESSLGYENKIYVPSEQEIEVEFTIKNKYEKEITGTLQLPEDKKVFFHTVPYIISLTPTKMVIAFKFKKEHEPSEQNNFLGATVPLDLKIHDKKTNRLLSKQNINANCNTAPLPIPDNKIVYKAETDEYVIELPRNNGIHNDLKEVKLLLSSKYGSEGVKTTVVPITTSTEGSLHTLTIKGNMEGQLATPQGDRKLEAIVYDKAGLNSSSQQTSKMRVFTSLTLVPPNDDVDLESLKAEGAIVPKIKELVDYFQTQENWEKAGYTVSYESNDFKLEKAGDTYKLMPKNPNSITAGSYNITVKLSSNNISPSPLTKIYEINVLGDNDAGIKASTFAITDVTNYLNNYPNLIIATPSFGDDGSGGKECEVMIPYTGFVTKLKVHVDAVGSGKITETNSGTDEKNDFDVDLAVAYGSNETLTLYARSSGGTSKQYKIKFIRKESVSVNVSVANELLQSDDCKVEMSWTYGKKEISINKGQAGMSSDPFNVAKGAGVTFKITAGNGDRIKECSSNEHIPITIDNPKTKSFELLASRNFILTVKFRAEASFKWADINASDSKGYKNANVSYYLNSVEKNDSYPSSTTTTPPEKAMQKGKECKFWIEWDINATKHRVSAWFVNSEPIIESKDDGSIILSDDKTSLTIKNVDKDYVVKVSTAPLYELTLVVCDKNNATIATHAYSFEVRKDTASGEEINKNNLGKYAGIPSGTQVYITAQEGSNSEYDIVRWELKKDSDSAFVPLTGGSEINKRNLTITENTTVRLILKKKTVKVEWSIEGNDIELPSGMDTIIQAKVNATAVSPGSTETNVELNGSIELEVTRLENGRTIKGWKVDDELKTTSDSSKGITISLDKKKLTLTNVKSAHTVVLVLEAVKHKITIEIEGPAGGVAPEIDKYTIEVTENNIIKSADSGTKYTYSGIIHSENSTCKFKAVKNGSIYEVGKWQYYDDNNGSWQPYTDAQYEDDSSVPGGKNPTILKIAPNKDLKLKLVLKT